MPWIRRGYYNSKNTAVYSSIYFVVYALVIAVLFLSGHRIRVEYETNNEEKRKNNLNLHLSKSLHHIVDPCIMDQPSFGAIIFSKFCSIQ